MGKSILCVANGTLFKIDDGKEVAVPCQSVDKYKRNLKEIRDRKEWKTKNEHNAMGLSFGTTDLLRPEAQAFVSDAKWLQNGYILYSFACEETSGFYVKNANNFDEPEEHIISRNDLRIFDFDSDKSSGNIIASVKTGIYSRNIALFHNNNTDFHIMTEGDCVDANPVFSKTEKDIVLFDTCGIGLDKNGAFSRFSNKAICRFDYKNGIMDEIISNEKFDCFKPKTDNNGNMYYLKRPYQYKIGEKMTFVDFLLIPFKIIKGLFGWLDFFTKRYAGESLKTSGTNPAKMKEKSEEELFIEGNLIQVEKTLKENQSKGDRHAGFAPKSWELIRRVKNGYEMIVAKGVLDYDITSDGEIYYSNGKYIKKITKDEKDEMVCPLHMSSKISVFCEK